MNIDLEKNIDIQNLCK